MNAQLLHVVAESLPSSRKVYHRGSLHAELRVPMREIQLHPSSGDPELKSIARPQVKLARKYRPALMRFSSRVERPS